MSVTADSWDLKVAIQKELLSSHSLTSPSDVPVAIILPVEHAKL